MGRIVKRNQPCLDDKCGSSDARQVYEDGGSTCFSCGKSFHGEGSHVSTETEEEFKAVGKHADLSSILEYDIRGFQERGITKTVSDFYGVRVEYNAAREIVAHYYPYGPKDITGYKVRKLPKVFSFIGKMNGLFGQRVFSPGGRRLVITEGELDAMSVAQAWQDKHKSIYPVVSLSSATGIKELLKQREWIRSFEQVVLWFDSDDAGRQAEAEAAKIVGYDKVYIVRAPEKDASDVLVKAGPKDSNQLLKYIYDAKRFSPAGIISSEDTWNAYKSEAAAEYIPWAPFMVELNNLIYGRRMGSITMITSGTGMGKTSWIKEDQYHLLKTTPADNKIGILSLEESIHETVINLMAIEANKRIQLPDVEMTDEEERHYWTATMASGKFLFLDHQGSVEDSSLLDKIEFMALSGCKFIYLDHITIAVSESDEGSINSAIDSMMSGLLKLVKKHNIWLGVVSHLRKTQNNQKSFEEGAIPSDDDLKGSGSLKQVPMQILAISRNKMEKDPIARHTSRFWILKDRFTGRTGPAGAYRFMEDTGRLIHCGFEEEFDRVADGL